MDQDPAKRLVTRTYQLAFDLGNGRSIAVNGNFYLDDDAKSMNEGLDQIWNVLERLRAKVQVEDLTERLKTARVINAQTEEILIRSEATLEHENKTRTVPNKQHQADIANHRTNILRQEQEIRALEETLAEKRAQAA
jgi:hypothetical protein